MNDDYNALKQKIEKLRNQMEGLKKQSQAVRKELEAFQWESAHYIVWPIKGRRVSDNS